MGWLHPHPYPAGAIPTCDKPAMVPDLGNTRRNGRSRLHLLHGGVHTGTDTPNPSCPRPAPVPPPPLLNVAASFFLLSPAPNFRPPNQKSIVSSRLAGESAAMGGGNAQKSKMAREKNLEKLKGGKGSQLEANKKAMNIQCKICMQTFICTTSEAKCKEHAEAKHPKSELTQCFPHLKQ
ncbi:hypothetical protein QYE76_043221 [Lolium multiflorum]|uniref:Uncharacterized protein n=2 Tax=Lolium TaxID=4520 RepID=A0AAD8TIM8_LOLMU|nr:hypothetical protein QYE76_043221 [Lolium multiflorum]